MGEENLETIEAIIEKPQELDSAPSSSEHDDNDWDDVPEDGFEEAVKAQEEGSEDVDDWTAEVKLEEEVKEEVSEETESKEEESLDGEALSEKKEDSEESEPEELHEVKIDGEVTELTIEELKSNYSGKVSYDKKFQELDVDRQQHNKEVNEMNGYINEFGRVARSGDAQGAMTYLAEFAGIPAYEIKEMLYNQIKDEVYRRETLTDEQLTFEQSQNKLKYDQDKLQSDQERTTKEQASTDLNSKILSSQETYGISRSEWDNSFKQLDELLEAHETITPDMVGKFATEVKLENQAVNILSGFDDRLKQTDDVIDTFMDFIKNNPSLSNDQLKAQVKLELDALEQGTAKDELVKKVEKTEAKKPLSKKNKKEVEIAPMTDDDGFEIDDFDDL